MVVSRTAVGKVGRVSAFRVWLASWAGYAQRAA